MYNPFFPDFKDKFSEFWNKIKDEKLTTAILQQFFFRNRNTTNILDNIQELFEIIDTHIDNEDSYKSMYN